MRAALRMTKLMHDLRIVHPPVPVITGDCIALPLPGNASLVILELERNRLVSFGYYLENTQGLPVPDPEFLVYQAADGQWFPLAITRYLGGQTEYVTYEAGSLTMCDPAGQAELADYLDVWAIYLRHLLQVPQVKQVAPLPLDPQTLSPRMQQFITSLATQYAVNLASPGAWLRLTAGTTYLLTGYAGEGHLVLSYGNQTGEETVPELQIVFWVTSQGWQPVEILNAAEIWDAYEQARQTTQATPAVDPQGQLNFAGFSEYWAERFANVAWVFVDCRPGETFPEGKEM